MSEQNSGQNDTQERASDMELIAILRKAKEEYDYPVLVTSQFNEIGDYEYSSTALNDRLLDLHEEGTLGHMKAANRHIWWLGREGTTESVDTPTLEELVDYKELNPDRFDEEKAEEIAKEAIPGFKRNWWQRLYDMGRAPMEIGAVLFFISLGLSISDLSVSTEIFGGAIIVGVLTMTGGMIYYSIGKIGQFLATHTRIPPEPWEGKNLFPYLREKLTS